MKSYRVLVHRILDGTIDVDAENSYEAEIKAEKAMEVGSQDIDWCSPEDSIMETELLED